MEEQLKHAKEELGLVKAQLFELRAQTGREMRHGGGNAARAVIGQVKSLEAMLLRRRMDRMKKMNGKYKAGGQGKKMDRAHSSDAKDKIQQGSPTDSDGKMSCRPTASLQLNKALSIGAERLHEIVVLKNRLKLAEKNTRDARRDCKRLKEQLRMNGGAIESIGIANRPFELK